MQYLKYLLLTLIHNKFEKKLSCWKVRVLLIIKGVFCFCKR